MHTSHTPHSTPPQAAAHEQAALQHAVAGSAAAVAVRRAANTHRTKAAPTTEERRQTDGSMAPASSRTSKGPSDSRISVGAGTTAGWTVLGVSNYRFSEKEQEFAAQTSLLPRPDAFQVRWEGRHKPTWEDVHTLGGYHDWPVCEFMLKHADNIRQQAEAIRAKNEQKQLQSKAVIAEATAAAAAPHRYDDAVASSAAEKLAASECSASPAAASGRKRRRRVAPPQGQAAGTGTAAAILQDPMPVTAVAGTNGLDHDATANPSHQPTQMLMRIHSAPAAVACYGTGRS
jgi:hypothetical protein